MSVIQISSGVGLGRRVIAVLHITETFHWLPRGDKPGLSRRRVRQYLPDTLHTVPGIFARIIFLFFHKNAVAEHIVAEQHGVTVIRKKAFYFFQGPCFPFRIGFALSCRCVFGFQGKDQDIVRLRHNIQAQLVCSFVHLSHIHGPADKPLKKVPAAVLLVFLHFSVELLVILPLAFLMLVSAPYLAQPFQKSVLGNRFQEIVLHADSDGLFRVIKIIIAAEDHDLDIRKFLFYHFAQCQTVHKRHLDVRNQKIRLQFFYKRKRHLPVRRLPYQFKPVLLPGNHLFDIFTDYDFVLRQKCFQHAFSSVHFYY